MLAFGLALHAHTTPLGRRTRDRAQLWRRARHEGFTLVEVFDAEDSTHKAADVWNHIVTAAGRTEITTVLIAGSGNCASYSATADEEGLSLVHLPGGDKVGSHAA